MQGRKIAIGGKGGVGKTTVCAGWAQLFAQDGFDVLVVDADPSASLASAFGIPSAQAPEPLINMKELIAERTGAGKDSIGAYFKLNPHVSDLPQKYWHEVGSNDAAKLKLLVLGAIDQAGSGCACPEGAFLKAMLTHTLLQREEMVMVDLSAGVEFMGRASVQGVNALVVVVEPGGRSIETANNVAKMARQLGIGSVAAIANKVTETGQAELIASQLQDMSLLGALHYSPPLQKADLARKAVIHADMEFMRQLQRAKDELTDLVFQESRS